MVAACLHRVGGLAVFACDRFYYATRIFCAGVINQTILRPPPTSSLSHPLSPPLLLSPSPSLSWGRGHFGRTGRGEEKVIGLKNDDAFRDSALYSSRGAEKVSVFQLARKSFATYSNLVYK